MAPRQLGPCRPKQKEPNCSKCFGQLLALGSQACHALEIRQVALNLPETQAPEDAHGRIFCLVQLGSARPGGQGLFGMAGDRCASRKCFFKSLISVEKAVPASEQSSRHGNLCNAKTYKAKVSRSALEKANSGSDGTHHHLHFPQLRFLLGPRNPSI